MKKEETQAVTEHLIPHKLCAIIMEDTILHARLIDLISHARLVKGWQNRLRQVFPFLDDFRGKYSVQIGKRSFDRFDPQLLHEVEFEVKLSNTLGADQELYWLTYSDQDYPDLGLHGISKGFTLRNHINPAEYNWKDSINADKWTEIGIANSLFEQITAISLYGSVSALTQQHPSQIRTLLHAYAEQKSHIL